MKNSGFTLVEMGVVLTIIGLIAAAILSGREIVEASRTRALMAEVRDNMQSFESFTDKYRSYPGDFPRASTLFAEEIAAAVEAAKIIAPNASAADFDGDGNNKVEWGTGEGALAWYHMQLTGITKGKGLLGVVNPSGTAVLRSNVPASGVDNFGYFIDYSPAMQNYMGIGRQQETGINNGVSLTPIRTETIDKKMDDGRPTSGIVQAIGAGCLNANGDAYNFLNDTARETISCLPQIRLN